MESGNDLGLLELIARRRDRTAFNQLFMRYQRQAFNLAFHLIGNPDFAQDAVQEAMLEVWLSASSYQPGNEAGWILRIVANKSLSLARRRSGRPWKHAQDHDAARLRSETPSSSESAEQVEMLELVRASLQELPALERQIVTLHYGAGLSLNEVAAVLSLSRTAVVKRLNKALALCRSRLEKAGCAAALPLLAPQALGEVLLSGLEPPPGLQNRVLTRLEEVGAEGPRSAGPRTARPRWPAPTSALAAGRGWLLLGSLAAAAGIFLAAGPGPDPVPAPRVMEKKAASMERPAEVLAASSPLGLDGGPFRKRWTFQEDALPEGFGDAVQGSWGLGRVKYRPEACLIAPSSTGYPCLLLPGAMPPFPFVIEAEWSLFSPGKTNVDFEITDGEQLFPKRARSTPGRIAFGCSYLRKFYFLGSVMVMADSDGPGAWVQYEGITAAANRVCLSSKNALIFRIDWRSLKPAEVPPEILAAKARWEKQDTKPVLVPGMRLALGPGENLGPAGASRSSKNALGRGLSLDLPRSPEPSAE